MKKIVTGILAHVDSGKTTLSEALLYHSGMIRTQGRVDHGSAFLDSNEIEREKGITIFSKEARILTSDSVITLLDTPGHVDFSAETERTLDVLDYCILVISGTDGVQSHTETLWKLLKKHNVPVFIFINKMDISQYGKDFLMEELRGKLSENCVELNDSDTLALCHEKMMDEYINTGSISKSSIEEAISRRDVFPCHFGSALKSEGIEEFWHSFTQYIKMPETRLELGAKVYKISRSDDGTRLTHMKITGGELKAKDIIEFTLPDGSKLKEKADTIRIYSGEKFYSPESVSQGDICAVTGLNQTYAGMGIGFEENASSMFFEPVLTYKLEIIDNTDIHTALMKLRILQEEDPQLHITLNEQLREIHMQLMGEVQIEVLRKIIAERFNMNVDFSEGAVSYRETIEDKVEGVGHFEPLRHYSEVHLILEPAKRGSGIVVKSECSEDLLDKNWQRLILTHINEKTHLGILTGSPITDIKITLVSGKAHKKHTEGGDFREATYRAIRQGLMQAKSVLLEPYYEFTLCVPTENAGRAMTDLQQMNAEFSLPDATGEMSVLKGIAPVYYMRRYSSEIASYTHGRGKLTTSVKGYFPSHEQDRIVAEIGYNPDSDTENPSSSVFCAHGSGFVVPWNEVENHMHLESVLRPQPQTQQIKSQVDEYVNRVINDEELLRIFEKTYGPIKTRPYKAMEKRPKPVPKPQKYIKTTTNNNGKTYLLVDGYNIIFAWEDLKAKAEESLDLAREILINRLCNYCGYAKCELILVFDAYKVKGGTEKIEKVNNISVVYTKEAETADAYIEKTAHVLAKNNRVRVATSDGMEQIIILAKGAERVSASQFEKEVEETEKAIRDYIRDNPKFCVK